MDNSSQLQAALSSPDINEHKAIKRHYLRLSLIIIMLVCIFNGMNSLMLYITAYITEGNISEETLTAVKEAIRNDSLKKALYSYAFPIAGDICAICIGLMVTKSDLKAKINFKGFDAKDFSKFLALTFGLSTAASFINVIFLALIKILSGDISELSLEDTVAITPDNNPLWLNICIYFYMCLLGPVLEELIFRGVLLDGLRKYGNMFGIIISSVLFGLVHQNFVQCIPAAVIGLVFAYMTVKSGSIIPAVFAHILNNSLAAILMILMNNVDLTDVYSIYTNIASWLPLLIAMGINMLIRLVCIIATVIIAANFFSERRELIEKSVYCTKRTWKYFFTSPLWILVLAFLLYSTVTSIAI